jgi:hypothetical protein
MTPEGKKQNELDDLVRCLSHAMPRVDESRAHYERRLAVLVDRFLEMRPNGPVERMLAVQMIAAHEMSVRQVLPANMLKNDAEIKAIAASRAAKLMRLFTEQATVWNRLRGGGQQNVTVKYVHVGEGGQAIVGNVALGEKKHGGSSKSEPPAVEHREEAPLDPGLPETWEPVAVPWDAQGTGCLGMD